MIPGAATTIYVRPDGPYVVTGDFSLQARGAPRDDASVVLCRCGRSSNKPYCDGAHVKSGFRDSGDVSAASQAHSAPGTGRLTIVPLPNGPLNCLGPMTISGGDGRRSACRDARLCRCGGSSHKPLCDDSHRTNGFAG
jgi:CDGSH-type Zn-finger protein